MLRSLIVMMCVGLCSVVVAPTVSWGQKNAAQERKDDERVRDAENALKTARNKLEDAQKDVKTATDKLNKADREHDQAVAAAKKAREAAQAKADESPAIRNALDVQDRAKSAYDKIVEPLLEKVHASPEYRQLVDAAERARTRLRTIRSEGLAGAQLDAEITALNRAVTEPSKFDTAAIEKDSAAAAAREKFLAAQAKVVDLRKNSREDIEKDPQVRKAINEAEKTEKEHKQAIAKLADARRDLANHQRDVHNKQQGVENAKAADRKNDNNNNNNKKKKK